MFGLQASRNKFIRDVTHPLTQCTLKRVVEEYIAAGYTLIKEDFLNLAATEGERMNMSAAPTGMAACKDPSSLSYPASSHRLLPGSLLGLTRPCERTTAGAYPSCPPSLAPSQTTSASNFSPMPLPAEPSSTTGSRSRFRLDPRGRALLAPNLVWLQRSCPPCLTPGCSTLPPAPALPPSLHRSFVTREVHGCDVVTPACFVGCFDSHARHQGCEQMYGGVEYGMNQFAGGWWLNGLYSWLDPDLVALQGDYWFRAATSTSSQTIFHTPLPALHHPACAVE